MSFELAAPFTSFVHAEMSRAPTASVPVSGSRGTRILLIDDDRELCRLLAGYLAQHQLAVDAVHTPAAALDRLAQAPIDLVLLDVKLPERDGFAFCRELRAAHDLPIIILSAWGSTVDRILGLELGGDDYLTKPCDPRELVARIRCVLRRGRRRPDAAVLEEPQTGLVIDRQRHRVWLDGAELALTGMQYDLLCLFVDHPGRLMSRDDIINKLRGLSADIFSRAVDVNVSRLRQKLGDGAQESRFIRTVWGRGYIFVGTARQASSPASVSTSGNYCSGCKKL